MAKKYHSYGIKYVADRGRHILTTGRFIIPSDVNASMLTELISIFKLLPSVEIPCPDSDFRPRKLEFIRASGNTFSIILAENIDILDICRRVVALFANNQKSAVLCIKLVGEYWPNIYHEFLPTSGKTITPGKDSRGTSGKQLYYKGTMKYQTDVPFNPGPPPVKTEVIFPFRMASPTIEEPPDDYKTAISGCIEEVETVVCPPPYQCKGRHYLVTSIVHEEGAVVEPDNLFKNAIKQTLKIPITHREELQYIEPNPAYPDLANDIFVCGKELAEVPATICLGYRGESCDYVHKFV